MQLGRRRWFVAFLAFSFLISGAVAQNVPKKTSIPGHFFPYEIKTKTLANGLTIVVIRTPEFKDMVTYSTAVFAGSGRETEKGKTGLAHLFEHIMFPAKSGEKPGGYDAATRGVGANNNA